MSSNAPTVGFQLFEAEIREQFVASLSRKTDTVLPTVNAGAAAAPGPSSAAIGMASNGLEPHDSPDLTDDLLLDDVDAFIARQSLPVKNELIQWEPLGPNYP